MPSFRLASQREELRRAQVEHERVVAPGRIDRDLLAGRRIDLAIVVVPVRVEVAAGRQVVRARARQLQDGRELDAERQLEHAGDHEPVALVGPVRPPLAVAEGLDRRSCGSPAPDRLPVEPPYEYAPASV